MMRRVFAAATSLGVAAVLVACGDDGGAAVLRVPADHGSIQAAVDAASAGDLVLVEPGVYHESVTIGTNAITLRGTDRNEVILDGESRLIDGVAVTADGVAVENLTIRNYRQNGVIFNGASSSRDSEGGIYGTEGAALFGYRVSYVTAANNGLYGIYAFASQDGLIEHSYASGSPDSGLYIGQCKPCNVLITDSVAAFNAIGYYGTNASGGVYVVNSTFRDNRLGMTPNSQDMELLAPQVETVIAGNLVVDNDNPAAPPIAQGFFGAGIAVGGGTQNTIIRNRVSGHEVYGIGLVRLNQFEPIDNVVEGNVVEGNGVDLYLDVAGEVPDALGNCFADNTYATSIPDDIEAVVPCVGAGIDLDPATIDGVPAAPPADRSPIPLPADQPNRPGDPTEVPVEAAGRPAFPDLDSIVVPTP